jgi:hypothetical protein
MIRRARNVVAILAVLMSCSAAALALGGGFKQTISVPPGTVSVTVINVGTNAAGQITSSNVTSFCPAGNTITVTLPANTSTTTYGAAGSFYNAAGQSISGFTVVNTTPPDTTSNAAEY